MATYPGGATGTVQGLWTQIVPPPPTQLYNQQMAQSAPAQPLSADNGATNPTTVVSATNSANSSTTPVSSTSPESNRTTDSDSENMDDTLGHKTSSEQIQTQIKTQSTLIYNIRFKISQLHLLTLKIFIPTNYFSKF